MRFPSPNTPPPAHAAQNHGTAQHTAAFPTTPRHSYTPLTTKPQFDLHMPKNQKIWVQRTCCRKVLAVLDQSVSQTTDSGCCVAGTSSTTQQCQRASQTQHSIAGRASQTPHHQRHHTALRLLCHTETQHSQVWHFKRLLPTVLAKQPLHAVGSSKPAAASSPTSAPHTVVAHARQKWHCSIMPAAEHLLQQQHQQPTSKYPYREVALLPWCLYCLAPGILRLGGKPVRLIECPGLAPYVPHHDTHTETFTVCVMMTRQTSSIPGTLRQLIPPPLPPPDSPCIPAQTLPDALPTTLPPYAAMHGFCLSKPQQFLRPDCFVSRTSKYLMTCQPRFIVAHSCAS